MEADGVYNEKGVLDDGHDNEVGMMGDDVPNAPELNMAEIEAIGGAL